MLSHQANIIKAVVAKILEDCQKQGDVCDNVTRTAKVLIDSPN